jgi:predicted nuclease with TOPRIM domain
VTQGVPIKRWWVRNNTKELEEVSKMTVEITLAVLVSIASLSFSVYMGLKNNKRTDEKEIAERIARDTRTDMKLDEISKDIKEVKETVKNIQNDVKDHEGRIVKLEASYKAEHKRLDEIFSIVELKERE